MGECNQSLQAQLKLTCLVRNYLTSI